MTKLPICKMNLILIATILIGFIPSFSFATNVSGIIKTDTTWNLTGSPYNITSDIQIAHGYTLSINEGVVINGDSHNISIWGNLIVNGSSDSKVVFYNTNISPGDNDSSEPFSINIQFSEINSGSLYKATGSSIYGSLSLKDSELKDIPYLYIWYPVSDCFIERNIFDNSEGISIGHSGNVKVYVTNNVFYNQAPSYGKYFAIRNWASYNESETIVQYNSFLSTDRVALELPSGYGDAAITATNNYWNTTDTSIIDGMIYDKNDDLACAGYIDYTPFLTSPHPDTPTTTMPPTTTTTTVPPTTTTTVPVTTTTIPPTTTTTTIPPTTTTTVPPTTTTTIPPDPYSGQHYSSLEIYLAEGSPEKEYYDVDEIINLYVNYKNSDGTNINLDDIAELGVEVDWITNNPIIATVSDGQVEFNDTGKVRVIASSGGMTCDYDFMVGEVSGATKPYGNLIILAGGDQNDSTDKIKNAIQYLANRMYSIFKTRGFTDEDIYYINHIDTQDLDGDGVVDGIVDQTEKTVETLQHAVQWAEAQENDGPLYLYVINHGEKNATFLIDFGQILTATQFDAFLDNFEDNTNRVSIVMLEACYSGSFIDQLADTDRVIFSSSAADKYSFLSDAGDVSFSQFLSTYLLSGYNWEESFDLASNDLTVIGAPYV
jgi:hypothetical protein